MEENSRKCMRFGDRVFVAVGYVIISLVALAGVLPFFMLISGSFTSEQYIINNGYSIIPHDFSTAAYKSIFDNPQSVLRAYGVTIFITAVGMAVVLFFTSLTAYVLHRRDFPWRNKLSFFMYFTTLFSGGLAPWYILMMNIGMKNNIAALIIPHMFTVFNVLIVRNYMQGLPYEMIEAAKIDGANDFKIYVSVTIPLIKPVLATIALFSGLTFWNEWYNCMLFISKSSLYTLQYYLYNLLNNASAMKELFTSTGMDSSSVSIPTEGIKLSMTVVATGPIILLYPFVQKYFVKSITVGSVKG